MEILKVKNDKMRSTGKTTRFINFVIEQLLSSGQCIATDEDFYTGLVPKKTMYIFAKKIEKRIENEIPGNRKLEWETTVVNEIPVFHFKLLKNG